MFDIQFGNGRRLGWGLLASLAVLPAACLDSRFPTIRPGQHGSNPGNPPTMPPPPPPGPVNAVSWRTSTVALMADDFWILADGQRFSSRNAMVAVHSDPGDPAYTTLELTWQENAREMRLFIYFHSDGVRWWSDEMRTYDAQPSGDWLYYLGTFFETPVGGTFHGDIDLSRSVGDPLHGELHIHGLSLTTTLGGGSGTGGQSGSGGRAGSGGGRGGSPGSGATSGAGGTTADRPRCNASVSNKSFCNVGDEACALPCGPKASGVKNCDCISGLWSCPLCSFDLADPAALACFQISPSTAACPADPSDPSGMGVPMARGACALAPCSPCGSASSLAYRDAVNVLKVGYCVCDSGAYSCAPLKEWPPQ